MLRILSLFGAIFLVIAAPKDKRHRNGVEATPAIISSDGYAVETHQLTTEDGYVLAMHRIPFASGQTTVPENRPVVFVMHGLYGASYNFVARGVEHGFAYHLVDAGFDVWLGNARGNTNSRAHVTLNPDDPEDHFLFFDFSWEQIGMYDLPAMIDYALNHTGQEKLHYIGHSQGGTVFLVLGSTRPEYNEKLASVHLLAGVGYQDYFPHEQLASLAALSDIIYEIALGEGLVEVNNDIFDLIIGGGNYTRADMCFGDIKYKYMCDLIGARHFLRDDPPESNLSSMGGGSIKQIAHYGQNIRDKLFRRYHYGTTTANQEEYGTPNPPIYDIGLITANVTMHYTVNDILLDEKDVLAMAADMPNTAVRKVARDSFLHEDFVAAEDAKALVTDFIIEAINYVHNLEPSEAIPDGEDLIDKQTTMSPGSGGSEVNVTPAPGSTDAASDISLNMIFKMYLMICVIYSLF